MQKTCTRCKQTKFIENFGKSFTTEDGLKSACKECRNKDNILYRKTHKVRCYIPVTGTTKKCSICRKIKPIENFGKNCCSKDGRESRCKICIREYGKKLYKINRQNYVAISKEILQINTKICSKCKQEKKLEKFYLIKWHTCKVSSFCKKCWADIRKTVEYKQKFSERDKKNAKIYNKNHTDKKSEYNQKYNKNNRNNINQRLSHRQQTDPEFKTLCLLKNRVLSAVKQQGTIKAYHTAELIGCTVPHLMKHLESQFDNKMTWQNHNRSGWHIDHIIPCATFDLTKPEEQKKCFHYTNLRPMWGSDNLKKNSWYKGKLYRKNILDTHKRIC